MAYYISDDDARILREMLAWIQNFRGSGVANTSQGASFNLAIQRILRRLPSPSDVWVKVTSNAAGGGVYKGKIFTAPTGTFDPSTTAGDGAIGALPDAEDCYVVNLQESGQNTHDLTFEGSVVSCFPGFIRALPAKDGKPVVLINGTSWKDCDNSTSSPA